MSEKLSKDDIKVLKNEIAMAEKLNKEELEPMVNEAIARYIGVHIPAYGADWDIVLNEVYPIVQNYLPSLAYRIPRAFLKPKQKTYISKERDPITGQMVEIEKDATKSARTQEAILNYCLSSINYKEELRKVLLDALLFPHGILWHGYKGNFGMTEERSLWVEDEQIFVTRISPMRFLKDPSVNMANINEAKWVGRIIDIPYEDFIEDDELDIDKKSINGFLGFGDKVGKASENALKAANATDTLTLSQARKPLIEYTDEGYRNSKAPKFVRVYEIYKRPSKKEKREGKKGKIILYCKEQTKLLRENDWSIKAKGFPVLLLSFNELPDAQFGLPDIDTYKSIADQKNAVINLQLRNAQENTKVWVGISKEGSNEEDITKIQEGTNTIVTFESGNPAERMYVASPGGASSNELYLLDGRVDRNLQDKSGITDLKKGFLQSGEESAASVKLRAMGSGARPAYRQDIMADFLRKSFTFINELLKQFTPIKEAVRIIGSLDLEWIENPSTEDVQAPTDVDIDPISMLPEDPEKEINELNTILTMMIQGLRDPIIAEKIRQEGKTVQLSPLIEQILIRLRIRDPNIFRNIQPGESQGYVSVEQMREAKENVNAALTGQNPPFPPNPKDDHQAKLEIYTTINDLLMKAGQACDMLTQLIQIQTALLQQKQQEEAKPGNQVKLQKPSVTMVNQ